MSWGDIGGWLAALAGLWALGHWLKREQGRIVDAATARRFAERALAGFVGGEALVAPTGDAALVAGGGAVAIVERRGARVAVRRLIPPLDVQPTVEGALVTTGDPAMGRVAFHGITVDQIAALTSEAATAYRTIH